MTFKPDRFIVYNLTFVVSVNTMYAKARNFSHKFRRPLFASVAALSTLILCSFLPTLEKPAPYQAPVSTHRTDVGYYDSANTITNFADGVSNSFVTFVQTTGHAATSFGAVAVTSMSHIGNSVVEGISYGFGTVNAITANMITYSGRVVFGHFASTVNYPVAMVSATTEANVMSGFIRPIDNVDLPTIQTVAPNPGSESTLVAAPPEATAPPAGSDLVPQWPMSGAITTYFGVPHWPYQPTHTGMDISDGKRVGVTPILPFKPGQVTEVIRSNKGLGNHVTVDNGNGVTSVYAHLNSISVEAGQFVTKQTILGYEGTTGTSTGPHLHFEIKVNGVYTNPRDFIAGQP